MGAEADLGGRPALRGSQGRPVLPALRDRPVLARGGARLPRRRRPLDLRAVPGARAARPARSGRRAADLDHHALDPGVECRGRDRPRAGVRAGAGRRRGAGGRRGTGRAGARRGGGGARPVPRRGDRRHRLRAAVPLHLRGGVRAAGTHRAGGRLRQRGRRHGPGAHGDRVRRGRLPARRAVRAERRQPGAARRHLRRADRPLRGAVREGRRPRPGRRPPDPRPGVPGRGVRALLPALLALRHAAALLRKGGVVHPHDRPQGRPAEGQRGDRVVPVPHQARPVRQVAREQRRLGPVARALLGHAAAGVALRGGARPLRGLDRRAARAGGRRPGGPAQALHRRRRVRVPRLR